MLNLAEERRGQRGIRAQIEIPFKEPRDVGRPPPRDVRLRPALLDVYCRPVRRRNKAGADDRPRAEHERQRPLLPRLGLFMRLLRLLRALLGPPARLDETPEIRLDLTAIFIDKLDGG